MSDRKVFGGGLSRVQGLEQARDIQGLLAMLNNPLERGSNSSVRGAAVAALGRLGDSRAGPVLAAMSDDPVEGVRYAVARALGAIRYPDGGRALIEALDDGSLDVRRAAVISLGQIGCTEAIPLLRAALDAPDHWLRLFAAESLLTLKDPSLASLLPSAIARESIWVLGRRKRWRDVRRAVAAQSGTPVRA